MYSLFVQLDSSWGTNIFPLMKEIATNYGARIFKLFPEKSITNLHHDTYVSSLYTHTIYV